MGQFLMGVDCGGSSVRCSLVDPRGGRRSTASRPWRQAPAPEAGFFAFDIDTELCWRLVQEAAAAALRQAGAAAADVIGVAVTGMRFSAVIVDRAGAVLFAVPNHDARAAAQGIALAEDLGGTLAARTGHWPAPIFLAPRLQWLAAERPDLLARAACAFSLSDWLGARLTGVLATDPSQAAETLLYDVAAGDWAWDLVQRLGLPRELLPPVRASGSLLGPLTAAAAAALGLQAGVPVAVGGADTQCGLLGTGAIRPGQLCVVAGSTAPLQLVTVPPHVDPEGRAWAGRHVMPGLAVLESNAGATGDALVWLAGLLCPGAPDPLAHFLAEASLAAPGAGGMVSSLGAQVMDARDMLALPTGSLSLSHLAASGLEGGVADGRGNVARAVLEGMAFAVTANGERLFHTPAAAGAQSGAPEVRMTGGMTRSELWTQLVCDVADTPIEVSQAPEASVLGAAACAGVAAGVYADLAAGAGALVRTRRLEPDPARAAVYRELYAEWKQLQEVRAPADRAASAIALRDMMDRARAATDGARPTGAAGGRPTAASGPAPTRRRLRILATADLDDVALAELRALGDVTHAGYREELRLLTGDDLVEALEGCDVFITEVDIADAEALVRLPRLRVIAACRGQAVNVDLTACTALGIPVLFAPGRNAEAVADLALAFMLMLSRGLVAANAFLRTPGGEAGDMGRMGHAHGELLGHELWEKTVGLVGLGAVGRAVARRLTPFGARVLVYDPLLSEAEIRLADAEPATLDELLAAGDIVSLHAPVTDETRGLIDAARLAQMKPGAFLVNTARAGLVDDGALLWALREGRLGGAALDVFSVEPPAADDPLLALPNVIATPHVGGNTVEVGAHQGRICAADLRRMVAGQAPRHVLNPESLAGFSWDRPRVAPDAATIAALTSGPAPDVTDVRPDAATAARPAAAERPREAAVSVAAQEAAAQATVPPDAATPAGGARPGAVPAAQMERVLRLFLERAAADGALQAFAAKKSLVSHYVVSDLGLEFFIGFGDGRVLTGFGAPPEPAKMRLKAKGEVLDAILDGRLNGNKAAMTGKLSFSGDVRTAMGAQRVQKDFVRLYGAARAETGGIDFTAVAAAAPSGATGTAGSGRRGGGGGRIGNGRCARRPRHRPRGLQRRIRLADGRPTAGRRRRPRPCLRGRAGGSHTDGRGAVRRRVAHCYRRQRERAHPRDRRAVDHSEPAVQRPADAGHHGPRGPGRQRGRPGSSGAVHRARAALRHLPGPA